MKRRRRAPPRWRPLSGAYGWYARLGDVLLTVAGMPDGSWEIMLRGGARDFDSVDEDWGLSMIDSRPVLLRTASTAGDRVARMAALTFARDFAWRISGAVTSLKQRTRMERRG